MKNQKYSPLFFLWFKNWTQNKTILTRNKGNNDSHSPITACLSYWNDTTKRPTFVFLMMVTVILALLQIDIPMLQIGTGGNKCLTSEDALASRNQAVTRIDETIVEAVMVNWTRSWFIHVWASYRVLINSICTKRGSEKQNGWMVLWFRWLFTLRWQKNGHWTFSNSQRFWASSTTPRWYFCYSRYSHWIYTCETKRSNSTKMNKRHKIIRSWYVIRNWLPESRMSYRSQVPIFLKKYNPRIGIRVVS